MTKAGLGEAQGIAAAPRGLLIWVGSGSGEAPGRGDSGAGSQRRIVSVSPRRWAIAVERENKQMYRPGAESVGLGGGQRSGGTGRNEAGWQKQNA